MRVRSKRLPPPSLWSVRSSTERARSCSPILIVCILWWRFRTLRCDLSGKIKLTKSLCMVTGCSFKLFMFQFVVGRQQNRIYADLIKTELHIKIASWNVNSLRSRLDQVTTWLKTREPDVLLLQELKSAEFNDEAFKNLGYECAAVTQKAYNGVATLSRHPMETISTTLAGDSVDSHARFLEVMVSGIRIANIYLPNGNPVGTDKFVYKLAWMNRLKQQMIGWQEDAVPTVIGGDFNVIPEDIDCHKPSSWMHDALFQPEPRAMYRSLLDLGYVDAFRSLHPGEGGKFTYWDYFRRSFENNRGIRIDHFLLSLTLASRLEGCEIDKGPRAQEKPSDHTPIVVTLR